MAMQYKAFLYTDHPNRAKEIRRFVVDHDVASSYEYLRRKVSTVFPNLGEDNFALQWQDNEGDIIWLNSDEELLQALGQSTEDIFKLYIKESSTSQSQEKKPDFCQYQQQFQGFPPWGNGGWNRRGRGGRCPQWGPPPFAQMPGFFAAGQFGPCFGPPPQQAPKPSKDDKQSTSDDKPTSSNNQSQSQNTPNQFNGEEYLQNVGKAVSDFLHPFEIDVDIDVKTPGGKDGSSNKPTSGAEDPSASEEGGSDGKKKETESSGSEEMEWTFVKKNKTCGKEGKPDDKPDNKPASTETPDDNPRLAESLTQLLAMGFNNDGGWLANLLCACDYDISRALDKMQPARGSRE
nr:sequestosome-1 [Ciona intestinalis]|eukprot:XP_002128445.1 sequestosome-1 [Ciona intestinalis]